MSDGDPRHQAVFSPQKTARLLNISLEQLERLVELGTPVVLSPAQGAERGRRFSFYNLLELEFLSVLDMVCHQPHPPQKYCFLEPGALLHTSRPWLHYGFYHNRDDSLVKFVRCYIDLNHKNPYQSTYHLLIHIAQGPVIRFDWLDDHPIRYYPRIPGRSFSRNVYIDAFSPFDPQVYGQSVQTFVRHGDEMGQALKLPPEAMADAIKFHKMWSETEEPVA